MNIRLNLKNDFHGSKPKKVGGFHNALITVLSDFQLILPTHPERKTLICHRPG
jgi:hypothetical protein